MLITSAVVPDIVVGDERSNILKQSSSSLEITEITEKMTAESPRHFQLLNEVDLTLFVSSKILE